MEVRGICGRWGPEADRGFTGRLAWPGRSFSSWHGLDKASVLCASGWVGIWVCNGLYVSIEVCFSC